MKRYIFFIAFIVTLLFLISTFWGVYNSVKLRKLEKIQNIYCDSNTVNQDNKTTNDIMFVMKILNNDIGIFDNNGSLMKKLNINIKSLPEADVNSLRAGIKIKTYKELYALIEDYT